MSDRIYTIPAREFDPRTMTRHGQLVSDDTILYEVSLPGPSPRELLRSCVEQKTEAGIRAACAHWTEHADRCLVRRMRLRLWPVGARWDEAGEFGMYVLRGPSGRGAAVLSRSLHMLGGAMAARGLLRAGGDVLRLPRRDRRRPVSRMPAHLLPAVL